MGAHLQAPGPAGVEGGFVEEFILLLDVISIGDEDTFPASTVANSIKMLYNNNSFIQHCNIHCSNTVFI